MSTSGGGLPGPASPTPPSSRGGTSPIGTSSPNTGSSGNTNSSYAPGAFTSGIAEPVGTTYTVNNTDYGGVVLFNTASAVTAMLNSAVGTNFSCTILNILSGAITLSPTGGYAINGSPSLALASGQGATVFFANRQWAAFVGTTFLPVVPHTFLAVAHEWLNSYDAVTGLFTGTQPAAADLSDGTTGSGAVVLASGPTVMQAYKAVSTTYLILATDYQIECTSGTFTVTLPTAAGIAGQVFSIKNSGVGTITVTTTSGQTIDGSTTQTLAQYDNLMVMSNGSNWLIL